jgi:hypothetical protein
MLMNHLKPIVTAVAAGVLAAALLSVPYSAQATTDEARSEDSRARRGLHLSPVPLNLAGKDATLVGLGSYIVNAQSGCNDCHSASPATQYFPNANPYFGLQPARTNPATFLGGGRNFGPLTPGTPNIVSRNLTPDGAGRTLGGDSFDKFLLTLRYGFDPDNVHPDLAPPFDGRMLQIMPWPVFGQMSEHDLRAVYEYLGAIPCVEGGPGQPVGRCR